MPEISSEMLSESLVNEIVTAAGLPVSRFTHATAWHLFRRVTDRLAVIGTGFDALARDYDLATASSWGLTHFCSQVITHGEEQVPSKGPLMVVSNHPGAYDGLSLFSKLKGHDIRCVTNVIPFLDLLPNARKHFLFTPRINVRERMVVIRNAIKHLKSGGTLVYFASGHRDPDPAIYPGALQSIEEWLDVFDAFFKSVANLTIMPVIMSGVVTPQWARHPITWLRKQQVDRQRLAEFAQVISQLLHPGKLMVKPRISFGAPFNEGDLRKEAGEGKLRHGVIQRAKALYWRSSDFFGDFITSQSTRR